MEKAEIAETDKVETYLKTYELCSVDSGLAYPLAKETLVGREAECDLVLQSRNISRYHAKLTFTPEDGLIIRDLNSKNGTYVNGALLSAPCRLTKGDEVSFDLLAFRVVASNAHVSEPTELSTKNFLQDLNERGVAAKPGSWNSGNTIDKEKPNVPYQSDATENEYTRHLSIHEVNELKRINDKYQKTLQVGTGSRLVILTAPLRGKIFYLNQPETKWIIGRNDESDFSVPVDSVSRRHALVLQQNNDIYIKTISDNPIYINGKETESGILQHGDRIQIGRVELQFRTDKKNTPDKRTSLPQEFKFFTTQRTLGLVTALVISAFAIGLAYSAITP